MKILLVVVGVFLLGCVAGASVDSIYRLRRHGPDGPWGAGRRDSANELEHMRRELGLNEQQTTEIRAILDQTGNDYRALRKEVRPRYDAIRQDAHARIRAVLTPEQQQRFDVKAAEHDARRNSDNRESP